MGNSGAMQQPARRKGAHTLLWLQGSIKRSSRVCPLLGPSTCRAPVALPASADFSCSVTSSCCTAACGEGGQRTDEQAVSIKEASSKAA